MLNRNTFLNGCLVPAKSFQLEPFEFFSLRSAALFQSVSLGSRLELLENNHLFNPLLSLQLVLDAIRHLLVQLAEKSKQKLIGRSPFGALLQEAPAKRRSGAALQSLDVDFETGKLAKSEREREAK